MKSLTILKPGLYTSIQDGGRFGYRKYGVPVSGALDQWSAAMANALVNKHPSSALLEITFLGPAIELNSDTIIALSGADLSPALNGKEIQMNSAIEVGKGQILTFGKNIYGTRSYLAFKNDIISEKVLGSQSFCQGITVQNRFKAGDRIVLNEKFEKSPSPTSHVKPHLEHFTSQTLLATKGPEFDQLSSSAQKNLSDIKFQVSTENNRMGYRLLGHPLEVKKQMSMITSSILPGTVQLTPSGQLIILMRDCQTTGGYPRVLQLNENSINQLAQKKSGDNFSIIIS